MAASSQARGSQVRSTGLAKGRGGHARRRPFTLNRRGGEVRHTDWPLGFPGQPTVFEVLNTAGRTLMSRYIIICTAGNNLKNNSRSG